ncbi:MAG: tetratricopeptide repeat protein [Planctomycetota bacterium]|jgi:hypothetical protein
MTAGSSRRPWTSCSPAVGAPATRRSLRRKAAPVLALATTLLLALAGPFVHADTITIARPSTGGEATGRRVVANCRILAIGGGHVHYRDDHGQRQRRSLTDVRTLSFDDLSRLDEAELALASGRADEGLMLMLQALLTSGTERQQLWVHARLAQVHDSRGEYVCAARHAASVWRLDGDPSWLRLEPRAVPAALVSPEPAVAEAAAVLSGTRATLSDPLLRSALDRMLARIARFGRGGAAAPVSTSDRTVSGIDRAEVLAYVPATGPRAVAQDPSAPGGGRGPLPSTDSIARLVESGQHEAAIAGCAAVLAAPGDRDVVRLLHLQGRALEGAGRRRDAALAYLRVAILFPGSPLAPESLISAAGIYREEFANRDASRRLLDRAVELAEELERPELARRARDALAEVSP